MLPVDTYAPGPPSGALYTGPPNGITFPTPTQPVEGFSALLPGRHRGEYLAMADNGYGGKQISVDFLIRAYYVQPDFKTARRGSGTVTVGDFISFRDPLRVIGFAIRDEATTERLLTGKDIDPESMQRGRNGDLWMGDEFGPWILHFVGTACCSSRRSPCRAGCARRTIPSWARTRRRTRTAGGSRRWRSARTVATCTPPRGGDRRRSRPPALPADPLGFRPR